MIEKAKTYSRSANSGMWWDTFFEDQALILERYKSNTTTLCNDFIWPTPCLSSDQLVQAQILPPEVEALINILAREMYLGARRSRQRREELTELWASSIQDLKVGSMIATLAQDDPLGHPFWIAKVYARPSSFHCCAMV